jgi:oxygen-dependent protoporphyrinogen oxidase
MRDVVVVGAGIAGLAVAYELQRRGLRPLVIERQPRAGGVITTDRIDGYVIDGGPDSLLTQKLTATDLIADLGLDSRLVTTLPPRTAFVLKGGRLVPIPEASFLGMPTRWQPFVTSPLFSWAAKMRMAAKAFSTAPPAAADESIGAFVRRHFGEEAVRYLAEPLLAGIHAGNVDELSVHALFPRLVELERGNKSLLRALWAMPPAKPPQGAFVSFPTGVAELVDALVRRLGAVIQYSSSVSRIDGLSSPFTLTLASGAVIQTRAVILAIPAWAAASVLRPVEPSVARWCGEIPYVSSATVVFGFDRDQVKHPLNGTGFVVPRSEKRALMAATWITSKWADRAPSGKVLIRGFLGGARDDAIVKSSDFELAEIARRDLDPLLSISGDPRLTRIYRWAAATPQYNVGHLDRIRQIDERLARTPGLYLTGSGYRGTGIPDCIADARSTAAAVATYLAGAAANASAGAAAGA